MYLIKINKVEFDENTLSTQDRINQLIEEN